MKRDKNKLNILVEDERPPIYVTQEEFEKYCNVIVVEDVRNTNAHKKWSRIVKERSNYTCQCCGSKENLNSHHALSFKYYFELRLDLKNGVCLCASCPRDYHSKYNLKECSPSNLIDFIKDNKTDALVNDC